MIQKGVLKICYICNMNRMPKILSVILANKYIFAITLFVVWMLIFDENSILSRIRIMRELHELENKAMQYQKKIEEDQSRINALRQGNDALEAFARENYYMKAPGEEIFLIED